MMAWAARETASGAGRNALASWPNERTSPEEVFLAWLVRLPADTDVARAARAEIARLDEAGPLGPGPERLRALMVQLIAAA